MKKCLHHSVLMTKTSNTNIKSNESVNCLPINTGGIRLSIIARIGGPIHKLYWLPRASLPLYLYLNFMYRFNLAKMIINNKQTKNFIILAIM